ncbi:cation:proton antiporter [Rhodococcus zopfii]|uniref:Cation:proton antiporter n=2 Tax=Rhodococcus zopfii TaxID=43772 RepID=A0ABU3WNM1_9NOCA|nr:cation:proton antiporter [Rhodococcus zopfii]
MFATLALVMVVAIVGSLPAARSGIRLPLVLGELLAGIVVGASGLGWVDPGEPTLDAVAQVGFALVMFVAGTHVPVRDTRLRPALWRGIGRAALVGAVAVPAGIGLARLFDAPHAALFAVLLASSSAALVLPIVDASGIGGREVLPLLVQVAVADTVCIVALPLVIAPPEALRAGLGSIAVIACAAVVFVGLRQLDRTGMQRRVHDVSKDRKLAVELRVSLAVLFGLGALAVWTHVSVMLAGFALGLAVAAVGEPRRLTGQLFAVTEGFFAPVFYIWIGASIDVRVLWEHPSRIGLGLALGAVAVLVHLTPRATGQPVALGALSATQLGIPLAAVAIGLAGGLLSTADAAALVLGALVTIVGAAIAAAAATPRRPDVADP